MWVTAQVLLALSLAATAAAHTNLWRSQAFGSFSSIHPTGSGVIVSNNAGDMARLKQADLATARWQIGSSQNTTAITGFACSRAVSVQVAAGAGTGTYIRGVAARTGALMWEHFHAGAVDAVAGTTLAGDAIAVATGSHVLRLACSTGQLLGQSLLPDGAAARAILAGHSGDVYVTARSASAWQLCHLKADAKAACESLGAADVVRDAIFATSQGSEDVHVLWLSAEEAQAAPVAVPVPRARISAQVFTGTQCPGFAPGSHFTARVPLHAHCTVRGLVVTSESIQTVVTGTPVIPLADQASAAAVQYTAVDGVLQCGEESMSVPALAAPLYGWVLAGRSADEDLVIVELDSQDHVIVTVGAGCKLVSTAVRWDSWADVWAAQAVGVSVLRESAQGVAGTAPTSWAARMAMQLRSVQELGFGLVRWTQSLLAGKAFGQRGGAASVVVPGVHAQLVLVTKTLRGHGVRISGINAATGKLVWTNTGALWSEVQAVELVAPAHASTMPTAHIAVVLHGAASEPQAHLIELPSGKVLTRAHLPADCSRVLPDLSIHVEHHNVSAAVHCLSAQGKPHPVTLTDAEYSLGIAPHSVARVENNSLVGHTTTGDIAWAYPLLGEATAVAHGRLGSGAPTVLPDDSLLLPYPVHQLVAVASVAADWVQVLAVHAPSGQVVLNERVAGAGPAQLLWADNQLLVLYNDADTGAQHLIGYALHSAALGKHDLTPWSTAAQGKAFTRPDAWATAIPKVLATQRILPVSVRSMTQVSSRSGLTAQPLLLITAAGNVLGLDPRWLAHASVGAVPGQAPAKGSPAANIAGGAAVLPMAHREMVTRGKPIHGLHTVLPFATELTSTSALCAIGTGGVGCYVYKPAQQFDTLPLAFNQPVLLGLMGALAVGTLLLRQRMNKGQLVEAWM